MVCFAHLTIPCWRYIFLPIPNITPSFVAQPLLIVFVVGTKTRPRPESSLQLESTHVDRWEWSLGHGVSGNRNTRSYHMIHVQHALCNNCATLMSLDRMADSCLLLVSLLLLPSLVVCGYPWPDNATQYKGYIQVLWWSREGGASSSLLICM